MAPLGMLHGEWAVGAGACGTVDGGQGGGGGRRGGGSGGPQDSRHRPRTCSSSTDQVSASGFRPVYLKGGTRASSDDTVTTYHPNRRCGVGCGANATAACHATTGTSVHALLHLQHAPGGLFVQDGQLACVPLIGIVSELWAKGGRWVGGGGGGRGGWCTWQVGWWATGRMEDPGADGATGLPQGTTPVSTNAPNRMFSNSSLRLMEGNTLAWRRSMR